MSGGIFISYRRQDAAHAGRLADALSYRYGKEHIVFDVDTIAPGKDFEAALHRAVTDSQMMVVVIGPNWVNVTDAEGHRRLDDPRDFIRQEIRIALKLQKLLLPVLVGNSWMPRESELPEEIAPLARRNAMHLMDDHYGDSLDRLYSQLDRLLPRLEQPRTGAPATSPSFFDRVRMASEILFGGKVMAPVDTGPPPAAKGVSSPPPPWLTQPVTMSADEGPGVFLSYSTNDTPLLEQIARDLEGAGHRCWYAPRNVPDNTPNWPRAIVEAIAKSRLMVILVTKQSMESEQVLREVTIAADEKIPLLPFSIERIVLPPDFKYFFSTGQRLELAGVPTEQALERLRASVATRLGA